MMKITLCLFLNTLLSVGNAQTPCSAAVAEPFAFPTEAANNAAGGGGDNSGGDLTLDEPELTLEDLEYLSEINEMQNEVTRSNTESMERLVDELEFYSEFDEISSEVTRSNGESIRTAGSKLKLRRATHSLLAILQKRSLVKKQVELDCTSEETCFVIEDVPFCGNEQTADFHDEEGAGNWGTGSYTYLDGQVTNIYTDAVTRTNEAAPQSASSTEELAVAVTVEATPTHTSGQLARSTAARDSGLSSSSANISLASNGNNSGASSLRLLDITATSLAVLVGSLYGWTLIFQ